MPVVVSRLSNLHAPFSNVAGTAALPVVFVKRMSIGRSNEVTEVPAAAQVVVISIAAPPALRPVPSDVGAVIGSRRSTSQSLPSTPAG